MPTYLVDVNLPGNYGEWQSPEFISQIEINPGADDTEIWDYTAGNNLTIVTQDTDFYNKIIFHTPPPKVIWFRTGNMRLARFKVFVQSNWQMIKILSDTHKLVIVYLHRMEGIA